MPLPRVAIEARVAYDPDLRFGSSGTAVCNLRLVASDRRKNRETDEWEDGDTLWLDAVCFKQLAEHVAESVAKGDLLVVTGRLRTEQWEDRQTGDKRSKVSLICDTVSASLQFRTIPHGAGKAERVGASGRRDDADPWASQQSDEPPF